MDIPQINRFLVIGVVEGDTRSAEPGGSFVCSFRIACTRHYQKRDGSTGEETFKIDVETWGKLAQGCHEYLSPGEIVYVDGRLKENRWQDKTTQQWKSKLVIMADGVQFLGKTTRREERAERRVQKREAREEAKQQELQPAENGDGTEVDDIPF
jgi:single stranded DNA-binding protein